VAAVSARAGSWHVAIDGGRFVPDPMAGVPVWPMVCNARAEFRRPGSPVTHRAVCTRRAGHTGRHLAAHRGQVVAVWLEPVS
jgi:hypothetical protein